jgi:hypothetical protein
LVERTTNLDEHRGMSAQKETELRRHRHDVEVDQAALRSRQEDLERVFLAGPARGWPEAVAKARYLIGLFAETSAADDPRRQTLIADTLADFERLLGEPPPPGP